MKIKDIEKQVGITKANIRYYENEGLLTPIRNRENNYREYTGEDIKILERIKVLRALGVSIADIKQLNEGSLMLDEVMERRLEQIGEEEKSLREIEKVCKIIRQRGIPFEEVDEQILGEEKEVWKEQFERIWTEDITKEIITLKQLNRNLALMLIWGYFINAFVAGLIGNYFLDTGRMIIGNDGEMMQHEGIGEYGIFISIALSIICYIAIYFTASVKVQTVVFHVEALILTPLVAGIYSVIDFLIREENGIMVAEAKVRSVHLAIFWLIIAAYVMLLFLISEIWEKVFTKARYILGIAAGYTVIVTVLTGFLYTEWILTAIALSIFTLYIGLSWYHANTDVAGGRCSRYYAVTAGSRIMNIGGAFQSMLGKTRPTLVFR